MCFHVKIIEEMTIYCAELVDVVIQMCQVTREDPYKIVLKNRVANTQRTSSDFWPALQATPGSMACRKDGRALDASDPSAQSIQEGRTQNVLLNLWRRFSKRNEKKDDTDGTVMV